MKVILPILPIIGCHGNVPWRIGKTGPDWQHSHKYLPFGEKIVKIGPVDTDIALLNFKKRKETEGKIYRPVGNLAERAKQGTINTFNTQLKSYLLPWLQYFPGIVIYPRCTALEFFFLIFSAWFNKYISHRCYDVNICLSICDGSALVHYS